MVFLLKLPHAFKMSVTILSFMYFSLQITAGEARVLRVLFQVMRVCSFFYLFTKKLTIPLFTSFYDKLLSKKVVIYIGGIVRAYVQDIVLSMF